MLPRVCKTWLAVADRRLGCESKTTVAGGGPSEGGSEEDEVPQKKFTPKFPEAQPKSVGRTSKPTNEEGGEEDDALDYFRKLAQE